MLQSMLESTSDARVVVTARTTAGQPAESVVRVGPLPVPDPARPAGGPGRRAVPAPHPLRPAASRSTWPTQAHEVRRLLSATGGLPLLIEQVAVQSALVGLSNAMSTVSLDQAVDSAHELLDEARARPRCGASACSTSRSASACWRTCSTRPGPGGRGAGRQPRPPQPARGRLARGHFDMLSPIRGRARTLARPDDVAAVGGRAARVGAGQRAGPRQLRRGRRRVAARPAGHAPRGADRVRGARDARRRLLGGQPDLLLPLHLHARARGRRDPRGRPRQRRRSAGDRRPGRPPRRDRRLGDARHLRGPLAPRPRRPARLVGAAPGGAARQDRLDPRRDAPRRRRAGQRRRPRPSARIEPRPRRLDQPPGHPHPRRRLRLAGTFRRGRPGRQ